MFRTGVCVWGGEFRSVTTAVPEESCTLGGDFLYIFLGGGIFIIRDRKYRGEHVYLSTNRHLSPPIVLGDRRGEYRANSLI